MTAPSPIPAAPSEPESGSAYDGGHMGSDGDWHGPAAPSDVAGVVEKTKRAIKLGEMTGADGNGGNPHNIYVIAAELLALIESLSLDREVMREALEPFVAFAENVDQHGWTSNVHREGISVWFGPSDFRRARAALASLKGGA